MAADADTSNLVPLSNSESCWSGASSVTASSAQTAEPEFQVATTPILPPMTNNPKPHVCGACSRSFARLEHLKRHERTHTKEKPFECQQCTRRFARRDLLVRHQQKLHQDDVISSMAHNGCRESTSSLPLDGRGRVRKNTVASTIVVHAGASTASMRPRANTISHIDHIDASNLNTFSAAHHASLARDGKDHLDNSHHASLSGWNGLNTLDHQTTSTFTGNYKQHDGLQTLDTCLGLGLSGGMRTEHSRAYRPDDSELERFFASIDLPINPDLLHYFKENTSNSHSPFPSPFSDLFAGTTSIENHDFGWSTGLGDSTISRGPNEVGVDESSPSAIGTTSQSGFSEIILDGSGLPTSTIMSRNPSTTHSNDTYSLNPLELSSS